MFYDIISLVLDSMEKENQILDIITIVVGKELVENKRASLCHCIKKKKKKKVSLYPE